MATLSPVDSESAAHTFRLACRSGAFRTQTSNLCPGHIQANIIVLPSRYASSFRLLCARNPVPCPLLGWSSAPGDFQTLTTSPILALSSSSPLIQTSDFDIRKDLPLYNIYQRGKVVSQTPKPDITSEWTDDHTAFLIGCSFSFESALASAGLPPRHWESRSNVPMYQTTLPLLPAGVFTNGTFVVSMRPYKEADVEKVRTITRRYESTHGEPIAWGWDAVERLGIRDLQKPEFGDAVEVREGEGEIPVFWGCGVTPQLAVMQAGSAIEGSVMAHAPGHMLVLDLKEEELFSKGSA